MYLFLKYIFYGYVLVRMSEGMSCVGCPLKRVLGPMGLELQVTVCSLTGVMGSRLRFSGRAAGAHKC